MSEALGAMATATAEAHTLAWMMDHYKDGAQCLVLWRIGNILYIEPTVSDDTLGLAIPLFRTPLYLATDL